eukprot:TRINITY_DN2592_c0_g1_i1.p1 TRINITY_DN2592_c0_g1~~TRINITY_DN2592_c0_g1_i1.p1  ORF type:complete len:580 (-),score=92.31 TRINITY_DN2592_c0_g1_i1:37-1776(-)
MSKEESTKEEAPQLTVEDIIQSIKAGEKKNIVVMTGAGLSTAAGIPDFRSPGTGLYDNLQKYDLPRPEAIFDIKYFKKNPEPFNLLAKELLPGMHMPTLAHCFVTLLHKKGYLLRNFTQNIDGLEYAAELPPLATVAAHGSFHTASCITTGKRVPIEDVIAQIKRGEIPKSPYVEDGLVKPDIVFFGENLPERFHRCWRMDMPKCDLLIVMGTSLVVTPFALLTDSVQHDVPRLMINREPAGCFCRPTKRDVCVLGDLETEVLAFAECLGWKDELLAFREEVITKIKAANPDLADKTDEGATSAAADSAKDFAASVAGAKSGNNENEAGASTSTTTTTSADNPTSTESQEDQDEAVSSAPSTSKPNTGLNKQLALAVELGNNVDEVRALIEKGADPNYRKAGAAQIVVKLGGQKQGNSTELCSVSMVDLAVEAGDSATLLALIQAGADVNKPDEGGGTPLMLACQRTGPDAEELVTTLLVGGCDVNAQDEGGGTALIRAAEAGNLKVARLLVAAGADVNHRGVFVGGTPLYWATTACDVELIQFLLENGADKSVATNDGTTPLQVAEQLGFASIVKALQ